MYRLTKYRGVSNQFFRAWIRFYIPTWDLDLILYLHTGPGFDSISPHGTKFLAIHNEGLNSIWIWFYTCTCGLDLTLHPHGIGDMYASIPESSWTKKNLKKKNLENFKTFRLFSGPGFDSTSPHGTWIWFYISTQDLDLILHPHTVPNFSPFTMTAWIRYGFHSTYPHVAWIWFYIPTGWEICMRGQKWLNRFSNHTHFEI